MTPEHASRWRVTTPVAAGLFGLGLLTAQPVLLVGAVVPLGYALYGAAASRPNPAGLRAERAVSPPSAPPGAPVTVTLTLRNVGDTILPDVRVADGRPSQLALRSGSATAAGALAPGEALTCEYTLTARAGEYDFEPATVRLRSVAGERPVTTTVEAAEGGTLRCGNGLRARPTAGQGHGQGETATERRGGQEFFATREYRPGDAMGRIDWRHYAKTGEFVTQQYRDDRAGETVVLVDARPPACRAGSPGAPTGAEYAGAVATALSTGPHNGVAEASIGAVGLEDVLPGTMVDPTGLVWVAAGEPQRRQRAELIFDAVNAVARRGGTETEATSNPAAAARRGTVDGQPAVGDGGHHPGPATAAPADAEGEPATVRRVADHLSPGAELVVCTPLLDAWPVTLAAALRSRSHGITVVSPDVTDGGTLGARVAGLERGARIDRLEALGAHVIDWQPATGVEGALDELQRASRRGR